MELSQEALFKRIERQYEEFILRQRRAHNAFMESLNLTPAERNLPFYQHMQRDFDKLLRKHLHEYEEFLRRPRGHTESFEIKGSNVTHKPREREEEEEESLEDYGELSDTPHKKTRKPGSPQDRSNCRVCGKMASKICSNCKDAKYCGSSCQAMDWHIHSKLCLKG